MGRGRVVGLGLCVVDHTYRVDGFDLAATRLRYLERRVTAGGMIGTALSQAAALGVEAHVLSVVGEDDGGRFLRRELRRIGVRTRRLLLSPRCPTTVALVLVDARTAERRFVVPDRRRMEARAPALDLSPIDGDSVLLLDGHFPGQALRAARRAREVGATVIGDFHRPGPGCDRLLRWVHHPVVSEEFVHASGENDPRRALRSLAERCAGSPVVTQGARGGIYLEGRRVRRFRAHRVAAVDSTGAGDVFHGALAAGLGLGLELSPALDLASRAGALACTALGGAGRLMTRDELRRWLRRGTGTGTPGR